jgi:hypothetical protein
VSYIAFDLDALNVCPQVGAACGLSAAEASHGLLQLWAWCFRTESDVAADVHLRGFFQGRDAGPALEAFGFLARDDGSWRVRGAERYLRIKTAQRAAGRRTQNLKRGRKRAGGTPKVDPEVHPESTSGSGPALTPTTDDRAPNTESTAGAGKQNAPAGARPSDWIWVTQDFEAAGLGKYQVDRDKDPPAFKALLAHASLEEVRTRWRRGLENAKANRYPRVTSLAELRQHWNRLAVGESTRDAAVTHVEGRTSL